MDGGLFGFAVKAFTSMFIIMDPLGNIPIFMALTGDFDEGRRRRASRTAALTAFGVLATFAVAGHAIMSFFSISIPALRIAGGIIIFIIGLQMLQVQRPRIKATPEEELAWAGREDVGFVPLGIPLLAGPGAIALAIILTETGPRVWSAPIVVVCVAGIAALTHVILVESSHLRRLLGQAGLNMLIRLMGLLLAVIGVQFVLDGVAPAVFRRG